MSLTAEQIAARATGVGGSDAAAACGLSKWKSPLQLYYEKRGEAPAFEGNEYTKWGNYLEVPIRQEYAERTRRVVRLPVETLRHPRFAFMLCHPDGVTDDGRLFEAKATRSGDEWGEPGTDQIPTQFLIQVQHNMAVAGLEVADVAVLIAGSDFRMYEVPADREMQDMLASLEMKFWERVESGNPPAPTSPEDVAFLYGNKSEPIEVEAPGQIADTVAALRSLKAEAASIADRIVKFETSVKLAMGHADTLTYRGKPLATWKASKAPERVDLAALRAAHPSIVAPFVRTGEPCRRLLLKG